MAIKRKNPRTKQTWAELDRFRNFCVAYGYKFNPASLNNMRHYACQQFSKFKQGKKAKDQWLYDAHRFRRYIGKQL